MFEKIAGYEDVKAELLRIRDWCLNKDNINNPNITLPKGILFHGRPGNGKTLFLREYSKSFNAPVIVIEGNDTNVCKEIHKAFEKAKANEFSVVLIDEIDLLVANSADVERTLQSELDGVKSTNNVLVLATTNSIRQLGKPLLRSGRFDRTIEIENPKLESRQLILDLYIKKLDLHGDIDTLYLARIMCGCNGADIMAILNDAYLRCGQNVTTIDLEDSFYRVNSGDYNPRSAFDPSKANIEIAYHEVAHALLAYKNRKYFTFYKALFGKNYKSGITRFYPTNDKEEETSTYYLKQIEVSVAGYVMTKLKFHRLDSGCELDLQKSRDYASKLVDLLGYNGPQNVLPYYSEYDRMESEDKKRKNEITVEKIIKKAEKAAKRYLKANMKKADALVNLMMSKGYFDGNELEQVMKQKNHSFNSKLINSISLNTYTRGSINN